MLRRRPTGPHGQRTQFHRTIDPGQHTFRSNDPQSGISLDLKAGAQYFIRVKIETGLMRGHGCLVLMAREQASYELTSAKLNPLDVDKVFDKERVSVEVAHPQTPTTAANPAASSPTEAVRGHPGFRLQNTPFPAP